ncbi:MAG: alpha/beta hydrolase [Myxococcales bacterium]|nr:alpha/beta hydrolase [Myxococcales bacterium]
MSLLHGWRRGVVLLSAGVVVAWLAVAWGSGMSLSGSDAWAVAPGAFTQDGFSGAKKIVELPDYTVAVYEAGSGPPLLLLHGCPFSAVEWRAVIPELARHHRVIAPDLLGLGDTPVRLDQDYRLPHDVAMVRQLLDHYEIERAPFVGHDHGGATVLLLMKEDPDRIAGAILSNIEAYDLWPSLPEIPYLKAIVHPLTSPLVYYLMKYGVLNDDAFSLAFHDAEATLDEAMLASFTAPHVADAARWQRLRRFFRWQLDEEHNRITMDAVPAMREFQRPVKLLWGRQDENFGPAIAERLIGDLPGAVGVEWFEHSGHMPMLEEPDKYATEVLAFVAGLEGSASSD